MDGFEEEIMTEAGRTKYLRIALIAVGVTFIVGIYSLIMVWPSGWSWHAGQSHSMPHYLQMILGVYATLGVFLLLASRKPARAPEPDLVHRVVQCCARCDYGSAGARQPGADRAPLGRRSRAPRGSGRTCVSHPTRHSRPSVSGTKSAAGKF